MAVPTRSTVLPLPFATLMVMTVYGWPFYVVAVFSSGCREDGVSDLDDVDLEAVGVGDQAANLCVAEPVRSSDLIVQVDKREIELRRSAVIGNDLDAICL